jgi:hypothetical protein
MALKSNIVIKDLNIERKQKDGRDFDILYLTDNNGIKYNSILNGKTTIPDIGEEVEIIYQQVQNYNSIIGINMTKTNTKFTTEEETSSLPGETTTSSNFRRIKGTLYYPHVREPSTKGPYASGKYEVTISVNDTVKEHLEALGVKVKQDETKGNYVTAKSKKQPIITDAQGTVFTEIPLIGNGSTGIIHVGLYDNRESNVKAGKGGKKCLGLFKIELLNLVAFEPELLGGE